MEENMRHMDWSYRKIGQELKWSHETVRKKLLAAAVTGDLYSRFTKKGTLFSSSGTQLAVCKDTSYFIDPAFTIR